MIRENYIDVSGRHERTRSQKKTQQNAILEEIPKPEFLKILEEVTKSKLDL